jgi:CheY-like chemotaxis protein
MKPLHILVAEDNYADVTLFREALQHHRIEHRLHVVGDGQSALRFIAQMGTSPEMPCPDLMLLDLNLQKADGPTILQEFRKHPGMRPHACNSRHVV